MGGRDHINLGGDLKDKKKENIICLVLRWLPTNHFTHNDQLRDSVGESLDV